MINYVYGEDNTRRYYAIHDQDAENPLQWDEENELHVFRTAWNYATTPRDSDNGTLAAFYHAYDATGDADMALRAARHYANVYGTQDTIETRTVRGYSQGEWWDIVCVSPYDACDAIIEAWAQWARGDTFGVIAEDGETCDLGETHWTEVGALWGIAADSEDEAIAYYRQEYDN